MKRIDGLLLVFAALPLVSCGATSSGGTPAPTASVTPSPTPTITPTPTPAATPTPIASGQVFALTDPGETTASRQAYLAKSEVDGVAWRGLWKVLEPSDGTYAWTTLDAALDATSAAGKKITVHIFASGGGWPAWLTAAGAATYSGTSMFGSINDPVPWDPVYLARYQRFMAQLATHIAGRGQTGLVRVVSVAAPVAEMSLAGCSGGVLGTPPTSVSYSRSQYLSAWTTSASAVLTAFPSTTVVVSAPVTQICLPDGDGSAFYGDVMRTVPGAQIFVADLNALGSQRYGQVPADIRSRALFTQTIWSSTNDPSNRMQGTLSAAVCSGRALGARYFELYKSDLDSGDAAIRTAIGQARGTATCP